MHLNAAQHRHLERVSAKGRAVADAKRALSIATEGLQCAVLTALDDGVPVSRVAEAAGVRRPAIYRWLDRLEEQ